jgi:iron(III) transport system substrate-binding protein
MTYQTKSLFSLSLAVFLGATLLLPGAPVAAELGKNLKEITALAKKEGTVRIAASWRKKLRRAITKGFKKKYGLKIKATRVRGLASRERILNESIGGVVAQDVVNVSGELREQYIKAGVVVKVDWAKLFPKVNKALISPSSYYIATGFSKYGVAYNTKLVPPNLVPKTWEDCAHPRWKGKVAVMTRPRAYTALWAGWGREKSLAFHKKLKANKPVWSRGNTSTGTKIAAGEQPLGCGLGLHSVVNVKRRDPTATIAFKLLTEVPIQIGEGLAVMKGAKNPNAAVLLAGYLSSKEGEGHYHLQGRSSPFVKGSVADKMVKKAGAKLVWGGWKWAGKREAAASRDIVEAWGFPKAKR